MKTCTLALVYLIKYTELVFLIALTVMILLATNSFIQQLLRKDPLAEVQKETNMGAIILSIIVAVLVVFNLLFNNLLINLRFWCKTQCYTFGICCFDWVNYLQCHCLLKSICRDQCFTPYTLVKWVVKTIIIGILIWMVKDEKRNYDEQFNAGAIYEPLTDLDNYLLIYVLQHPIFMISRIPIYFLYAILTCCCDKSDEAGGRADFKDRILSFEYIEYELGMLNGF